MDPDRTGTSLRPLSGGTIGRGPSHTAGYRGRSGEDEREGEGGERWAPCNQQLTTTGAPGFFAVVPICSVAYTACTPRRKKTPRSPNHTR